MDYEIHLLFKAHNAIQKQKYKKTFIQLSTIKV